MRALHIGTSPITGAVYVGGVLKDGQTWASNKTDVTGAACAAVAQHAIQRGGTVVVTANGRPAYEITVKDISKSETNSAPSAGEQA